MVIVMQKTWRTKYMQDLLGAVRKKQTLIFLRESMWAAARIETKLYFRSYIINMEYYSISLDKNLAAQ
jgi:hypothetical protein